LDRLTARQLYDGVHERMALRWVAGMRGESRVLERGVTASRRPSLIGYLNVIYPNKIQIIGTEELNYLDSLDSRQRWEAINKIAAYQPVAMIVTKDQPIPTDLREVAEETNTPLWISSKRGHELFTWMQYHLARMLAPNSLAVVNANDVLPINADAVLPIQPNSDLFYLTGIEQLAGREFFHSEANPKRLCAADSRLTRRP